MTHKGKQPDFDYLAAKYKLNRERLEAVYQEADQLRKLPPPRPGAEQRKALKAVQNHSQKLHEALSKLGSEETLGMTRLFYKGRDLVVRVLLEKEQVEMCLVEHSMLEAKKIQDMAEFAQGSIKGGKHRNDSIRIFVMYMADFWYEEKGEKPTCYPVSETNSFDGEFYHFILDCNAGYTEQQASTISKIVNKRYDFLINKIPS